MLECKSKGKLRSEERQRCELHASSCEHHQ
jgi:hypothetical protein